MIDPLIMDGIGWLCVVASFVVSFYDRPGLGFLLALLALGLFTHQ